MSYRIVEVFDTFQGEGLNAGRHAVFVRFAGCNLWDGRPTHRARGAGECARWCDTQFTGGTKMTALEVENAMSAVWPRPIFGQRFCVLTGGEPLLQLDEELVGHLEFEGWDIAVETNGTIDRPEVFRHVTHLTVSPKLGTVQLEVYNAEELKVVLPGAAERGWNDTALEALAELGNWGSMFVQPQDPIDPGFVGVSHLHGGGSSLTVDRRPQYQANLDQCLAFVRTHPRWRLSLQTHKLLGLR